MSSAPPILMGVGLPDKLALKLGNQIATLAGVGTSQSGAKNITVNSALLTTSGGATAFVMPTTWEVGDDVTVFNTSATAALIFPQSGGSINGGSTDASVSVAQNTGVLFRKMSSTSWRAIASSASITGSFTTLTATTAAITTLTATDTTFTHMPVIPSATVAAAGSAQGDAAAITTGFTLVSAADGTKGVVLPAAAAGLQAIVKNIDAANAVLKVYPATGDGINAIAVNSAISMAAKTSAMFVAYDATTWYTVPLVPS